MSISFSCKSCGKSLAVKDSLAGKAAKCPDCGNRLRVPGGKPARKPAPPVEQTFDDQDDPFDFDDAPAPLPSRGKSKKANSVSANPYAAPSTSGGGGSRNGGPSSKLRLTRLGPMSVARMGAVTGFLGGLLAAVIIFALGTFVALSAPPGANARAGGVAGLLGGGMAMLMIPVFYGVIGFITGLFYACVYNISAGVIGGIEMEFE